MLKNIPRLALNVSKLHPAKRCLVSYKMAAYPQPYHLNMRCFSSKNQEEIILDSETSEAPTEPKGADSPPVSNAPKLSGSEKMEFKAETKKLLDIVAKSIYTDKEVFIRELLSNCSDALEKQRYALISGQSGMSSFEGDDDLSISITTDDKEKTITIFDSGIGMSKEQIMENLGTIAKSGSGEFKNLMDHDGDSAAAAENIIGQFGVGFYSSFVVSDHVEVYSRATSGEPAVKWESEGTGEYEVSEVQNLDFERGTKIILRLRKDSMQFAKETEVAKIIKKYSVFNKYPIKLNGEVMNNLQAIWYKDKREVT